MAEPAFLAWSRPAVLALATDQPVGARLQPRLPVTLRDDAGDLTRDAPFMLAGPGDVAGLATGQVIGRRPHPGCVDAETTMLAQVELNAPDLPWRYSPQPFSVGGAALRPWLVLVVGTPQEVAPQPGGRVQLAGNELFGEHRLASSARWAHVHKTPGRDLSRIMSPRRLEVGQDYVVALVPAWTATFATDGTSTLADAWTGAGPVVLPCYDTWTFRTTSDPGDFAALARRLEPLSQADIALLVARRFGRASVEVGSLPGTTLAAAGALMVVPDPGEPPVVDPLPGPVEDVVHELTRDRQVDGRWVLTLPRYDVPWHPGPVDGEDWAWPPPGDEDVPDGWRRQLRTDPRHRGAAGLGAWAAIAWQDRIADGAARQAGAVATAAERIRHLTLGLRAARALWARRVPADPLARLAVLSPLLGRMPVDTGGTALAALDGRTPALSAALLSSAARRVLRRRGPIERAGAAGATALGGLIVAANRCPDPPRLDVVDAAILAAINDPGDPGHESLAGAVRERAAQVLTDYYGNPDTAGLVARSLEGAGALDELLGEIGPPTVEVSCRPLTDLVAFADAVAAGVDPTRSRPVAVDRVLATLTGLREPLLAEPDVAPEIDLPLWSFLAQNAPDWVLPGAGDVPVDRVLAVSSNPAFVEAVLIGANVQTLGELRWRNLPITSRWTPLRRFWQRVDVAAGTVATDIRPVVSLATGADLWADATELGDASHRDDPARGAALVVVLHTELLRRYPATVVYLARDAGGAAAWRDLPDVDAPATQREYPSFSGTLTRELVFFGFDLPPSAATDHWLVLEEPPPGYRFRHPGAEGGGNPAADAATDGATFAQATFAEPVRVFLGNLL